MITPKLKYLLVILSLIALFVAPNMVLFLWSAPFMLVDKLSFLPAALNARRLKRAAAVYAAFTPIFWLAGILDVIFFFLPEHHMVLRAKRRMMWVPRVTPRLRDGRSIAEAALRSKIGTAAGK